MSVPSVAIGIATESPRGADAIRGSTGLVTISPPWPPATASAVVAVALDPATRWRVDPRFAGPSYVVGDHATRPV